MGSGGLEKSVRVRRKMGYTWSEVLDDPGPIKLPLSSARLTTSTGAVRGFWCLQVHVASTFSQGSNVM